MPSIIRTTSENTDFRTLVSLLDQDLAIRNGDTNAFYAQYNKIDAIRNVLVCYEDGKPIGCGAFKEYEPQAVEIKRMFVHPDFRGKRIGTSILRELEKWAAELNYSEAVLETGKTNPEAQSLYLKEGYTVIPNYGQYAGAENSVCMSKAIR
jgi:putative acetyltransferase